MVKNVIIVILVLLSLGLFLWGRGGDCPEPGDPIINIVHTRDTIRDTIPVLLIRDTIIYVDVPTEIDTAAILRDYFAVRYYERGIDEEKLKLTIKDSVSQNKIIWNELSYETYIDTVKITKTETIFRKGLYVNTILSTNQIGAGVSYMNRKGLMYGAGVSLNDSRLYPYIAITIPLSN